MVAIQNKETIADAQSNQPDDASERDKRRLAEELHIATVIDLRSQYVTKKQKKIPSWNICLRPHKEKITRVTHATEQNTKWQLANGAQRSPAQVHPPTIST